MGGFGIQLNWTIVARAGKSRGLRGRRLQFEPLEGRALTAMLSPTGLQTFGPRHAIVQRHGRQARPANASGLSLRNIVYRTEGDRVERLDLILPPGSPPPGGWPVVVAVHGGGWRRFSKEHYLPKVAALANHGFAVAAPSFTLSAPGRASWPENIEDLRESVRWLRRQAESLQLNPARFAAIGESSGAHLAMLLGTREGESTSGVSSRVNAVVSVSGPTDLAALVRDSLGGAVVGQMIGGPGHALPKQYVDASPSLQVDPETPPMLLIHGTHDKVVAPSHSQRMAAALAAAGVPHRLELLPGAGHEISLFGSRGVGPRVVEFLRRSLGS